MHRKLIVGGLAAAAAFGVASPAFADPTNASLSFDNVVIQLPTVGRLTVVSPSTQPLTLTGTVDSTTGALDFTQLSAPALNFSFSSIAGSVALSLANPATGTADLTTGAATLDADIQATVNVTGIGSCTLDTGSVPLSSSGSVPATTTAPVLAGVAFPAGLAGLETGNGAVGGVWSSLPAGSGLGCTLIGAVLNGPGGLWVSRGISPSSSVSTSTIAPKVAVKALSAGSVKGGKTASVKATVANSGGADSSSVKVCLSAPKGLSPARSCQTVSSLAASTSKAFAFKVKTPKAKAAHGKKAKAKTYTLTLTVTGSGISSVHKTVKLTVK